MLVNLSAGKLCIEVFLPRLCDLFIETIDSSFEALLAFKATIFPFVHLLFVKVEIHEKLFAISFKGWMDFILL